MGKRIKFLFNALLMILMIFPFQITHAIWWWEETVIFQNKTSGEYKKTYKMLYRFDSETFRDSLSSYIKDKPIPNDSLFKDWSVIYYKFCDRQDCTTRWNIDPTMDYHALKNITSSDFTLMELEKIYQNNESFSIGLIFVILITVLFLYRVKSRHKMNKTKEISTV